MDDTAVLGVDRVGRQVRDGGDVRVRRRAVVALVVVIRQDLPVEVATLLPGVVEHVVVPVDIVHARLLVDPLEVVLPRDLGLLLSVQVHPDEPVAVDVHVDRQQTILALVEPVKVLVPRRLGELAVQPVAPAVVLAREDARRALVLGDHGERPVAADVVEGVDLALAVADEHELEAGHLVAQPVAGVGEAELVRGHEPFAREDGAPLELEHLLRGVPRRRQGAGCVRL